MPIDGTEDANIQCLKIDGCLTDGPYEFQTRTAAFADSLKYSLSDEEDLVADILEPDTVDEESKEFVFYDSDS